MHPRVLRSVVIGALLVVSGALPAAEGHSEKALWIEFKDEGKHTTTIAMTEGIARELLSAKHDGVHFSDKDRNELLTREMLLAVLDGKKDVVEVQDDDNSTSARAYLRDLKSPARGSGNDRLIIETYKSGTRNFRIALPDIEVGQGSSDDEELVKSSFGWKGLLPFLAKSGGAVYIDNQKDDTEVWIYVD